MLNKILIYKVHVQQILTSCKSLLLEQKFSALPLRCEAGDGPHFDLNASVELFVPHVPHSLDWCCYCFVLKNVILKMLVNIFCTACIY